jgi:hypothetical protein
MKASMTRLRRSVQIASFRNPRNGKIDRPSNQAEFHRTVPELNDFGPDHQPSPL